MARCRRGEFPAPAVGMLSIQDAVPRVSLVFCDCKSRRRQESTTTPAPSGGGVRPTNIMTVLCVGCIATEKEGAFNYRDAALLQTLRAVRFNINPWL